MTDLLCRSKARHTCKYRDKADLFAHLQCSALHFYTEFPPAGLKAIKLQHGGLNRMGQHHAA